MGPIGVFDSGLGGLTVLRELAAVLPSVGTVYLGDTARVPYGVRSPETIRRYARENAEFLLDQGISALVVACNTATAVALDELRERVPVPVFGVVEPGARRAARAAPRGRILVLATEATTRSGAYERAIRELAPESSVIGRACPLFVPLAEEGWVDNDVARAAARSYLGDLADGAAVDAVVLGCTHYPLLRDTIASVLGRDVPVVDSARSTAEDVAAALCGSTTSGSGRVPRGAAYGKTSGTAAPDNGGPVRRFFVTDAPDRLASVGARFLGAPIESVEHVDVPPPR